MPPPGASRRHLATEPPSSRLTAPSPASSSPAVSGSPPPPHPRDAHGGGLAPRVTCTGAGPAPSALRHFDLLFLPGESPEQERLCIELVDVFFNLRPPARRRRFRRRRAYPEPSLHLYRLDVSPHFLLSLSRCRSLAVRSPPTCPSSRSPRPSRLCTPRPPPTVNALGSPAHARLRSRAPPGRDPAPPARACAAPWPHPAAPGGRRPHARVRLVGRLAPPLRWLAGAQSAPSWPLLPNRAQSGWASASPAPETLFRQRPLAR